MPTCIFAMAGSENAALVAAQTTNALKSVPRAVGSIWLRLSFFYVLGAFMVTITADPKNPNLFGGSGTNASPFVIAYREAKLGALADMMNAVIFISVLSTGSIAAWAGALMTKGLGELGLAPAAFRRVDSRSRPWAGLILTLVLGGGMAYLNVGKSSSNVFTWFSNLTSLFTLFGWGMICLSHLRMRHAWNVQGRSVDNLPWTSWAFPYSAWWGLSWCIILFVCEFYLAVWPLGKPTTAENFFANYVSVFVIVACYIGARICFRGPWWVDATRVNLDTGRRFYAERREDDIEKRGIRGKAEKVLKFLC